MDPTHAIPLDDDLKAKLGKFDRPVEVKDEYGRVVGTFVPQREYELLLAWRTLPPPPTREELEAARKETGRTIDDLLLKAVGR
ncbi:MAG: hypothetical protein K2X82_11315 [Gemmataceae bacterium]|nr:hypothetical protein [Gemmataceae bacterium]